MKSREKEDEVAEETKKILVVARDKKVEALRMAAGLMLLDDEVRVAVWGGLDESDPDVTVQMDSLDFAEVPVERLEAGSPAAGVLAEMMVESDAVFMV